MTEITLRELREDDVPYWYAWFNDPEVTDSINKGIFPNSVPEQLAFLERLRSSRTDVQFGITVPDKESHRPNLIGTIGIHKIDWVHRSGDVSIVIGEKEYFGKGIGTKAVRLIVRHGFQKMNLRKLTAGVWSSNRASALIFEKNGFVLEGTLRESFHYKGKYVDEFRYGLLRPDWETIK